MYGSMFYFFVKHSSLLSLIIIDEEKSNVPSMYWVNVCKAFFNCKTLYLISPIDIDEEKCYIIDALRQCFKTFFNCKTL